MAANSQAADGSGRRLDARGGLANRPGMWCADLTSLIDRSSTEERLFLAAYLRHLSTSEDPGLHEELAGAHREIEGGKKVGLRQLKRLHQTLAKTGL